MGDTDLTKVKKINNVFRGFSALLDKAAYGLLALVYRLFFNTSTVDIFSNSTVMEFYSRVQLIIGVFMMFQLVMIVLKGIMDPNSFTDSKSGGFNLITRISMALIMFALIIPINIENPRNNYQAQINNNGLLFGTLYSLQYRILSNNTIGKLVLGKDVDTSGDENDENSLKYQSYAFSSTVLKAFYRINLEKDSDKHMCAGDDAIEKKYTDVYNKPNVDPQEITEMVNDYCKNGSTKRYALAYTGFISFIVGFFFVAIVLSFTIDIAIRMIKLAILRLIAPIPIISYMDPKGSKDGAFNAWVKTLTATYLDLFIRLAVVYFVLFIIKDTIQNGIIMEEAGEIGVLTKIIVWAGLLIFAKESPKFFRQALGLKDEPFKLFGGFREIGTALGMAAAVPGAIGSARASARASRMADETRQAFGQNVNPNFIGNRAKHLLAGIAGGISGGYTGAKAAVTAKEKGFHSSVDAMRKRNQADIARGNSGSTLGGRIASTASNVFIGDGRAAATERDISSWEGRKKAMDAISSRVSGEMVKQDWTHGNAGGLNKGYVDINNVDIGDVEFNHKEFVNAMKKAEADGTGIVKADDVNGVTHSIDLKIAGKMSGRILTNNENSYIDAVTSGTQSDAELMSLIRDAEMKGGSGWDPATGTYDRNNHNRITSRDDYKKTSEGIGQDVRDAQRDNVINKANDSYSDKK